MTKTGKSLTELDYLRERMEPRPGDTYYLHTADLRKAIGLAATELPSKRILDFGSGGAPYRSLFGDAVYHKADLAGTPGIDFSFGTDSRLPVPDGDYDLVLSTQVLEHVATPQVYLRECLRVLKPGGTLLLTTHGCFPDHGCPWDFQRWTVDGLRAEIQKAGFQVTGAQKLTTGARAILFYMRCLQYKLLPKNRSISGMMIRFIRLPFRFFPVFVDRAADIHFSDSAIVPESNSDEAFYIAILVTAKRA